MFNKYLVLLLCILGLLGYFQSKLGELMVKKIKTHRPVKQRIIDSDDPIFEPIGAPVLPNPHLIFHNKLPKCGSTTMHNMLQLLSKWNSFDYYKLEPGDDPFQEEIKITTFMKLALKTAEPKKAQAADGVWPVFVFKHHYYYNTTRHGLAEPTWINLIRDPITWFESSFYFKRLGWSQKPGARRRTDVDTTIEQCIEKRHPDCEFSTWKYIQFFCGNTPNICRFSSQAMKKTALGAAKNNIEKNFYFIGILEEFMDSLKMFEMVMPRIYSRVIDSLNDRWVQDMINKTRTTHKTKMNEKSKEYFRKGPLTYEIDLYNFAKAIFHTKRRRLMGY